MNEALLKKESVYAAASAQSGIKRELLDGQSALDLMDRAVESLRHRLFGQDATFDRLKRTLRSRRAERFLGWDQTVNTLEASWDRRPVICALAVGQTGTGKTETARMLADLLFNGRLVMLNGSEVGPDSPHAEAMWTGSPPGYVGSDRGGVLTDALRSYRSGVILVDELEKASPQAIQNILIPLMGEGTVSDKNNGELLWATDWIVWCTSNIDIEPEQLQAMGFHTCERPPQLDDASVFEALRHHLLAEVIGRFNVVLTYRPLNLESQWRIWNQLCQELSTRIGPQTGINLDLWARRFLQDRFSQLRTGARGISDLFREQVVPLVIDAAVGDQINITMREDEQGLVVSARGPVREELPGTPCPFGEI